MEIIFWAMNFFTGALAFHFINVKICDPILDERSLQERRCRRKRSPLSVIVTDAAGGVASVCCTYFYQSGTCRMIHAKGLLVFAFLAVLMSVSVTDWYTNSISDRFLFVIVILGAASMWVFPETGIVERMYGTIVISIPMLAVSILAPGAFGGGDIKLMAVCGWLVGWRTNIYAALIGLFAAGCYCSVQLIRGKITRNDTIAFGPFLALGLAAAVFA
ncbi:MAG: A24 family peptidase [Eubacteriales bacterium]|nr:A24 family peptidase [Eubacteriales bacterium]